MAISAQATGSASTAKKPAFQQTKPLPVLLASMVIPPPVKLKIPLVLVPPMLTPPPVVVLMSRTAPLKRTVLLV